MVELTDRRKELSNRYKIAAPWEFLPYYPWIGGRHITKSKIEAALGGTDPSCIVDGCELLIDGRRFFLKEEGGRIVVGWPPRYCQWTNPDIGETSFPRSTSQHPFPIIAPFPIAEKWYSPYTVDDIRAQTVTNRCVKDLLDSNKTMIEADDGTPFEFELRDWKLEHPHDISWRSGHELLVRVRNKSVGHLRFSFDPKMRKAVAIDMFVEQEFRSPKPHEVNRFQMFNGIGKTIFAITRGAMYRLGANRISIYDDYSGGYYARKLGAFPNPEYSLFGGKKLTTAEFDEIFPLWKRLKMKEERLIRTEPSWEEITLGVDNEEVLDFAERNPIFLKILGLSMWDFLRRYREWREKMRAKLSDHKRERELTEADYGKLVEEREYLGVGFYLKPDIEDPNTPVARIIRVS